MIVAGVMSGTSADGIDVALARIQGRKFNLNLKYLGHQHFPYPARVRESVLAAMNAANMSVADLSRLNFLLAELYADAIRKARRRTGNRKLDLIGCHGQTIYHQGDAKRYLGREIASTWQLGEGAVIAARTGIPVVSDFRPADVAAGGKGAPLVPFLDYALFRDQRVGRIVQNLGGIANLTAIPANAKPGQVLAFDTGPGNMLIDQLMQTLFAKAYDRGGAIGARGRIHEPLVQEVMRHPFFRSKPPKTAGREEFGREFADKFLRLAGKAEKADIIASATALTCVSITDALRKFVLPAGRYHEYIVSGGGVNNKALMSMLAAAVSALRLKLRGTEEFGIPSQAKEAVAFAVMAYQTWHRQPANIPSATGAKRPSVLGKISYA